MADFSDLVQSGGSLVPDELNFDYIDFGAPPGEHYMMPDFFDPSIILPMNTTAGATTTHAPYVDSVDGVQDQHAGISPADKSQTFGLPAAMRTPSTSPETGGANANGTTGQQQYTGQMHFMPPMLTQDQIEQQQQQQQQQQIDTISVHTFPPDNNTPPSADSNVTTTTTPSIERPSKRRRHNKSRTGCTTCKKRRVKCDEAHPRCGNCSHLGLTCSFQTAGSMLMNQTSIARRGKGLSGPLRSPQQSLIRGINPGATEPGDETTFYSMAANAFSGSSSMLGLGTSTVTFNLEDLRLMHVYTTTVSLTIIRVAETQAQLWQTHVPELAFQHAALMHALLAFSGSYVVRRADDAALKAVVTDRVAMHRSESLRILRTALQSQLSPEMADAALLTGFLLMLDSIANTATLTDAKNDHLPTTQTSTQFLTATPWVHLIRGICCIVKSVKPIQPRSHIQTILINEFYDLPFPRSKLDYNGFAKDLQPYSIRRNFVVSAKQHVLPNTSHTLSHLNRWSKEDEWLYDDEDDLADIYPLPSTSPFLIPCFMLTKFKSVLVTSRSRFFALICVSLGLLDDRFYVKFHSDDTTAHRLIAEQYRALKQFARCNCKDVWWLENMADGLDIEIVPSSNS
ncbi:hypothetical protein V1525DRAFT_361083 [Lipomyces kononenkoae]|uniref:Uncharacterized protein n=1 Tax=Lipomyces kononenkoae TaxID=34357 RepID=A0ACC3T087_LIPKO